jgi:hypothetical protein
MLANYAIRIFPKFLIIICINFRLHQCEFRRNRSNTDQIFCIRQILEKKWEYEKTVHQLFVDFKKAHDSVRTEVLYNILIEFGVPIDRKSVV